MRESFALLYTLLLRKILLCARTLYGARVRYGNREIEVLFDGRGEYNVTVLD